MFAGANLALISQEILKALYIWEFIILSFRAQKCNLGNIMFDTMQRFL